ncbi:MAG: hypothetical protein PHQ28_02900 [Mycobacterium sp.]|nr:hypothetical protein [Mycobacterium sp.]
MSTLKQRGWTDGAIKRFLGEPDALVGNPNYRSGPKMRLYDLPRVEAADRSEQWRRWFDTTKTRRAKASAQQSERMNTSRAELSAQINAVVIRIPYLAKDELFGAAVAHRNTQSEWHAAERGHYHDPATVFSADPAALQRWAVNYLRHVETGYDWLLDSVTGRVGVTEARRLIRERVLDAIADQYPYLAAKCARQQAYH